MTHIAASTSYALQSHSFSLLSAIGTIQALAFSRVSESIELRRNRPLVHSASGQGFDCLNARLVRVFIEEFPDHGECTLGRVLRGRAIRPVPREFIFDVVQCIDP